MKKILIVLLLSVCCLTCIQKNQVKTDQVRIDSAQAQKKYLKNVQSFIEIINEKKQVSLSDQVDKSEFLGCFEELKRDTVSFTKSELAYIIQQSENPPIKKWTNELIPEAKLINGDTLNQIFKNYNKGWMYFYKKIGREFTSFSAPIFLRNNQYCIFYIGFHCGDLCGEGQLSLYKRERNMWKKVKTYCDWIS